MLLNFINIIKKI